MKMKRGTDHNWNIRKYKGDIAFYAHCRCSFQYVCSTDAKTEDGMRTTRQIISKIYLYCPQCGARKKWYNEEPIRIDKFSWEA
jgi:hypothetical protein